MASALRICTSAAPALAGESGPGSVSFEVWRKAARIGAHAVSVQATPDGLTATIAAHFVVSIGPIPVFRYEHAATEVWRDGRFASLEARSISNGKVETVHAVRTPTGVLIQAAGRAPVEGPQTAAPLTHWNIKAFGGPMFNPQTGALMPKEHVQPLGRTPVLLADGRTVDADAFALTGAAQITDWYDGTSTWTGLRARVMDGSSVDYRRIG